MRLHLRKHTIAMDDEENAEIAAAMGFASFGGAKKRKFDHTNSPKAKADASGANSTELGVRTKKISSTDEMDVEDSTTDPIHQAAQSAIPSPDISNNTREPAVGSGLATFLARGQSLPEKPPVVQHVQHASAQSDHSATDMVSFGGPSVSRTELNALRNGVQNEAGDTAYFLPSFVEDPWAKLRKDGGI
ncbi:hypothetical protein EJ02DRAFT_166110 [Clathrospora elynae]|uniref:Uncharacterized protein n=1 Tax=Clathrospora elynae TaxID=706981 RepID=A0A6A5SVC5_9PLEO|nr:hypothetical protein EJ02DRAFT_166110 [Clathrospora elynae]